MSKKSVQELIFDKFAESVKNDSLFQGVSADLINAIRLEKPRKSDIASCLKKDVNENSGT